MNRILTLSGLAATSSILMTTTALADISASEVWQAWQEDAARMGMTLSANTQETNAGVDLSALEFTVTIPQFGEMEAPAEIRLNIGEVSLNENDGAVSVIWPDSQQGVVSVVYGKDGGALSFEGTTSGRASVISGSVDEMIYDISLDDMSWKVSDWSVTGNDISTQDLAKFVFELSVLAEGLTAKTTVNRMDGWHAVSTGTTAKSSYDFLVDSGTDEGRQATTQTQTGGAYEFSLTLPDKIDFTTPEGTVAALQAGLALSMQGTVDDVQQQQTQVTPMGEVNSNIVASDLEYAITANQDLVKLTGVYGETQLDLSGGPIPPVTINASGAGVELTSPLVADGSRARYMISLNDFTLNDEIWGIFDPTAVLARDPAQLTLDLSADPVWKIDILDLAAWDAVGPDNLPLAPTDIRLDAFELTAAGASITGTGEMKVNYDDVASGGDPVPAGHIKLAASGVNGLMDNLVKMGFLPEQQAMGARMMMGLIAVPGEGEDTLKSRIEMTEEGHILANGMRLK
ncbi:hypothetical protein [Halocynthiibacter namhaensis]|uniref:hypothetical protein n=1 Tax=Halocynthiibacter namhaensis TaxID=1290553 RepID=UPI00069181EE|nr:hypothetical protein [Halocynthiibacter namhaensis]